VKTHIDVDSFDVRLERGRDGEGLVALVARVPLLPAMHRVHVLPFARTEKNVLTVGQIFSCIFIMQLDFSLTFLVH
jgi:hypothetical protein